MAEIIEKQELPVTITKVKIGKKDLTKKLIDQLPFCQYVCHLREDGSTCYGLPVKYPYEENYLDHVVDRDRDYFINGTIMGYISIKDFCTKKDYDWILSGNKSSIRRKEHNYNLINYSNNWEFIIFYHEGKLMKGIIDSWTIKQLGIELEQIII